VRNPGKIDELEMDDEEPKSMIRDPSNLGVVRFYHDPESLDSSHAGVIARTFQGTTSIITDRSPFQIEGARWHLLNHVLSDQAYFHSNLQTEISLQESLDTDPKYRSFSWQALRRAREVFDATIYIGETGLTTPPFFLNARRGTKVTWGVLDNSPVVVNW